MATLFFCSNVFCATAHVFPDTTIVLEDGDIILNDSVGASSVFNQEFGFPYGPYSHASVYVEFPNAEGMIVGFTDRGVVRSRPATMLTRNFRLALLRPVTKPAPGVLAQAFETLSARPLSFDFDMRWPELNSNQTYCAGFISQLHRLAGLVEFDPFPRNPERPNGFWDQWAKQRLQLDLSQVVSPNAPLFNPRFRVLAQYQSDQNLKVARFVIAQTTVRKIKAYIADEHLEMRPPKPGSGLILKIARTGVFDGVGLAGMPEPRRPYFLSAHEYMVRVEQRVLRSMRLSDRNRDEWTEGDIRQLTETVADAYQDDFFVKAPSE